MAHIAMLLLSSFETCDHSARSASSGSSSAALRAGSTPATSPMTTASPSDSATYSGEIVAGIAGSAHCASSTIPKPSASPPAPPIADSSIASPTNSCAIARPPRADRAQQADLLRSLAHGDRHDREDADAADEQRDAAERRDAERQHVDDRPEHVEHLLLRDDSEVLGAVACRKNSLDAVDDLVDGRVLGVEHVDLEQPLPVEQLEAARGRNVDRVVEVDADHVALRFHDADDAVALAADADPVAERVRAAVELRVELRAEHGDVARALELVGRQERAGGDVELEGFVEVGPDARRR